MDLTQLEVFRAVAQEGSVTAAAEKLHRVPSNISTRLRQLEEELGVALFDREKLRLHITDAGRTLLDYAGVFLRSPKRPVSAFQASIRRACLPSGPLRVPPPCACRR